jgi:hypothetical protein
VIPDPSSIRPHRERTQLGWLVWLILALCLPGGMFLLVGGPVVSLDTSHLLPHWHWRPLAWLDNILVLDAFLVLALGVYLTAVASIALLFLLASNRASRRQKLEGVLAVVVSAAGLIWVIGLWKSGW